MSGSMHRREFLSITTAAGAAYVAARAGQASPPAAGAELVKLKPFNFENVTLGASRWQQQYKSCRDFYFGVKDDDILCGYRRAASLPAPGNPLGGWCAQNSNTVFGQWLQGMSRIARATDDKPLRDKAILLVTEWAKTLPDNGNSRMNHYPFEKLVGGLLDMKQYLGHDQSLVLLERVVAYADGTLDRTRRPATPRPWENHSGAPLEWYTMGENLLRAYQFTKNEKYKTFGDVWLYTPYWEKFAASADAKDVWGVHAYSHVNSFSSCAMAYAVTGDAKYLAVLKNAYDFMQNSQTFATGGYGPVERLMPPNGNLGESLEARQNSCETPCCSWAAFKMARYLMTFTGEARYGDWIEKLLYNGIGGILPITENGKNFYYADYRVAGGYKTYARSTYTCCSGTYIQAVAEYPNLIYFQSPGSLHVNLYLPSTVSFGIDGGGGPIKVTQATSYPEADSSEFTVALPGGMASANFALKFRVPGWSSGVTLALNGNPVNVECKPGTWATIERPWKDGDKVTIRIPLSFRYQPVDKQHPDRVAIVRGPVVMVQEAAVHEPMFALPANNEELNKLLVPSRPAGQFALLLAGKNAADPTSANSPVNQPPQAGAKFMPFYAIPEVNAYHMYFDREDEPKALW